VAEGAIFRVQNGFRYRAGFAVNPTDIDGSNYFNGIDFPKRANQFAAPHFISMDMRIAKRSDSKERIKLHAYLEFFNLFVSQKLRFAKTQAFQLCSSSIVVDKTLIPVMAGAQFVRSFVVRFVSSVDRS